MILFVEGPRACGKTYLIENFLEVHSRPTIEYYKFYFADHIKLLSLQKFDATPSLHYFSLGNIMTILEMNQREQYKDKVWLFDRAILSAYAWAILRGRLSEDESMKELGTLLNSWLYKNCKTILIDVKDQTKDGGVRQKDMFDGAHSTKSETYHLLNLAEANVALLMDKYRGNALELMTNEFDDASQEKFNKLCIDLLGIQLDK